MSTDASPIPQGFTDPFPLRLTLFRYSYSRGMDFPVGNKKPSISWAIPQLRGLSDFHGELNHNNSLSTPLMSGYQFSFHSTPCSFSISSIERAIP